MAESIESQVRQVMGDVLNVSPAGISPSAGPQEIEGWDSVQHLNLVLALEQAFAISIAPEEIEKMQSLSSIMQVVQSKT